MADTPDPRDEPDHPPQLPAPWEQDACLPADAANEDAEEAAPRPRHDAFTPARRAAFLKHLAKAGCILDACREVGVSSRTVYRLQESDPEFRRHCELALSMARTPVELAAWERGVVGIEEEFVRAGQVFTRIKRSDSILRLLLQGSDRRKYGPNPGFKRKRLLKFERRQMEREIHAQIAAKRMSFDDAMELLDRQLRAMGARHGVEPGGGDAPPREPPEKGDSV